jgi:hypothetical protein
MFFKTLKLSLTFSRSFFFTTFFTTLICLLNYWHWKIMPVVLVISFWLKIVTYLFVFFYIKNAKRKEFYYYQALGISKTKLWITALSIDFILFVVLMIITNKLYNA